MGTLPNKIILFAMVCINLKRIHVPNYSWQSTRVVNPAQSFLLRIFKFMSMTIWLSVMKYIPQNLSLC